MENERRHHHELRDIFEDACRIASPFIDPANGIGGMPMTRHAYVVIREYYPQLTTQKLSILVHAVERTVTMRLRGDGAA
jgi:hypothetical protein